MPSHIWATAVLADLKQPLELHIPCREPLSHLMSQCNHRHRTFNCEATRLTDAVRRCMIEQNRFSKTLWSNNRSVMQQRDTTKSLLEHARNGQG
jgi:hypothetical protein